MANKALTNNLAGLDVPLNDRFSWFGGHESGGSGAARGRGKGQDLLVHWRSD